MLRKPLNGIKFETLAMTYAEYNKIGAWKNFVYHYIYDNHIMTPTFEDVVKIVDEMPISCMHCSVQDFNVDDSNICYDLTYFFEKAEYQEKINDVMRLLSFWLPLNEDERLSVFQHDKGRLNNGAFVVIHKNGEYQIVGGNGGFMTKNKDLVVPLIHTYASNEYDHIQWARSEGVLAYSRAKSLGLLPPDVYALQNELIDALNEEPEQPSAVWAMHVINLTSKLRNKLTEIAFLALNGESE